MLARHAGVGFSALPADQYLPPGMPGFSQSEIYSLGAPNVARARRLAGARHARAEMYTCNQPACLQNAESVKSSLRAIGIDVHIRRFPFDEMFAREFTGGEPWDIAFFGWGADYVDPADFIDFPYIGSDVDFPGADEPSYRHRIAAATRLTGQRRLRAYGKLDIDIATHAAPVIAFANVTAHDFFSARIGCQTFQPVYGMDLATLCERPTGRH